MTRVVVLVGVRGRRLFSINSRMAVSATDSTPLIIISSGREHQIAHLRTHSEQPTGGQGPRGRRASLITWGRARASGMPTSAEHNR